MNINRFISLFVSVMLCSVLWAQTPPCANSICYNLLLDTTAEVTSCSLTGNVLLPKTVGVKIGNMSDTIYFTITGIAENAFSTNASFTSVTIPATVNHIGQSAFALPGTVSQRPLTAVHFADSCSRLTIDERAFMGCFNLREVYLPFGTDTLRSRVFRQCHAMRELSIPNTVKYIGAEAFGLCDSLKNVYVDWDSTQLKSLTIGDNIFLGVTMSGVKLHVPKTAMTKYQTTAPWSGFNIISDTLTISANQDPANPGVYYCTFYDSSYKYQLPATGVEAYVAELGTSKLTLTKIAENGDVLPANTAVILKASAGSFDLRWTNADPVTFTATNNLLGTDVDMAIPAGNTCYVLSGRSTDGFVTGVGFYKFTGTLQAHKAYVTVSSGAAPTRLAFEFDDEGPTTDMNNVVSAHDEVSKILRDGQMIIVCGDKEYNAQGQLIK